MLLIPAENAISKKNPPYLTITLILINIFAYIFLQGQDNEIFEEAYDSYTEAELLTQEKTAFEEYALEHRIDVYQSIQGNSMLPDEYLVQIILQDKHFANHIQNLSSYSLEWRQKREKVNNILEETSLYQYAYYPSDPSIFTAFTHMFMHGGIDHLVGNMLFLFLFGFNLELILGRGKTLSLYILSGLAAVLFFGFTTKDPYTPLVGASGAIAGLMGGFGGWYGLKNIRYFYWFFVIFDYIKLPAALVFLFWLGKEFIMSTIQDDNVAYMAHFGGLLAGFLCAISFKLLSKPSQAATENTEENEAKGQSQYELKYHEACTAFQQLDFERARQLFTQLIEQDPNRMDYYSQLFALEKITPNSRRFEEFCNLILLKSLNDTRFTKLSDMAISELTDNGNGLKVLPADSLINYAGSLIKKGKLHQAKPIINFLVKHYDFNEDVPKLLFRFGLACEQNNDHITYEKIFTYLSKKHPESFVGVEAKKALGKT
ncbi:rhomboid family protein [Kangiella sediminilitoris]|uniref:Rhomboid family protein n=1 Tax=Kangiella sediminilitoris TaxID=1144748 RepID=A0A1B3BCN2_9GAMM|nr:rhomboid family intramembrane serine protease [Kangiella sediminilitoris]AOE50552.1 Rhomboid family protein [Kangiella sediminilitoris]